ncbi:MAG: 4'-phosphopantetheinyl transferase superfamily protein [Actinomycetia bacterium]|nr:4'-phosphopantetheinyl transferase superfamily protein [Actinomycetes bacterium]
MAALHASVLDDRDRERIARYHRPALRHQHVVARSVVRSAVAHRLGTTAARVRLGAERGGRPTVRGPNPRLHLSLSHSFPFVAVATSWDAPVGVDVESIDAVAMARLERVNIWAPGERDASCAATVDGRTRLWCAKEAVAKAAGLGVILRFASIAAGPGGAVVGPGTVADGPYAVVEGAPASTHRLAVATPGPASVAIVHGPPRFGAPLDGVFTVTASGTITTHTVEGAVPREERNVE